MDETRLPSLMPQSAADLPMLEELPRTAEGYDPEAVREAFAVFRRHLAQVSAQLRVVKTASPAQSQGGGHAIRIDALHLIREAAEFADALERDAQDAATQATAKAKTEIEERERALVKRELEADDRAQDSERQSTELLAQARQEAQQIIAEARHEASRQILAGEQRARELVEDGRHQAQTLVDEARREVTMTLDWARQRSRQVVQLGQETAVHFMSAAGIEKADAERHAAEFAGDDA